MVGTVASIPNRYIHDKSQAIDREPNVTTTLAGHLVGSIALPEVLESHPGLVVGTTPPTSLFNILIIIIYLLQIE